MSQTASNTTTPVTTTPVELAPNLITHEYQGGARIASYRGLGPAGTNQPEEWIGSTVPRAGEQETGLARTTSGEYLRNLIAMDRASWIGEEAAPSGDAGDTGVLFKLLDAGQRLPVHFHPGRSFARSHLGCPYGKTEAWVILEAEPGAAVYLGWKEHTDLSELAARRDAQDSEWMLSRMNRIPVKAGMGIFVPAGTVHAIGEGVLVAEVQEPTDFSAVLEWSVTTLTREQSHLGVGFDTVMNALDLTPMKPQDLAKQIKTTNLQARSNSPRSLLPVHANPYFRISQIAPEPDGQVAVAPGLAVAVIVSGSGTLTGTQTVSARAGKVLAIPAAFGPWTAAGDLTAIVVQPGTGWPGNAGTLP